MDLFVNACLFFCVLWAVAGPLLSPWIEKRLEWFLFGLGVLAMTLTWSWREGVVLEALIRPMKVSGAVLLGSLVFSFSHDNMRRGIRKAMERLGPRLAVGLSVVLVGAAASVLTTVIAMLALVELLYAMKLERESEMNVAVLGSFAIGLGGGMTPIAGPIPAITMAKLADASYEAGSSYLFGLLGAWIVPAILTLGVLAAWFHAKPAGERSKPAVEDPLTLWSMLVLAGRMYVFIAGLVLLGEGLVPVIDKILLGMPPAVLFWVNSVSAVIDGATLAALEISPNMSQNQLRYILMGVLIAGGALVTGNAPNLVAAHKLKIPIKDWARIGLPAAALLMTFYFISLGVYTGG